MAEMVFIEFISQCSAYFQTYILDYFLKKLWSVNFKLFLERRDQILADFRKEQTSRRPRFDSNTIPSWECLCSYFLSLTSDSSFVKWSTRCGDLLSSFQTWLSKGLLCHRMQSASDKLISCAWRTDEHHLLTRPMYFLSWSAPAGAQIKQALWQSAYITASRSFPKPQSVTLPVSPALHLLNTPGALSEPVRRMVQRDDLKGCERGCSRGTDELRCGWSDSPVWTGPRHLLAHVIIRSRNLILSGLTTLEV